MDVPTQEELLKGVCEFEKREKRDPMYRVATFLVSHFWGKPSDMADGLGVLLLTWNQAFYRYGSFDFGKLEKCIHNNLCKLESFRNRDVFGLSSDDEDDIKQLFAEFLEALQIDSGKKQGHRSPVAVAKALHILAPRFFPLWDNKIAEAYGCYYNKKNGAEKYISFCKITENMANQVKDYIERSDKTLCKFIDQYNYSKYTQEWI